jgi:hypothetical protein
VFVADQDKLTRVIPKRPLNHAVCDLVIELDLDDAVVAGSPRVLSG